MSATHNASQTAEFCCTSFSSSLQRSPRPKDDQQASRQLAEGSSYCLLAFEAARGPLAFFFPFSHFARSSLQAVRISGDDILYRLKCLHVHVAPVLDRAFVDKATALFAFYYPQLLERAKDSEVEGTGGFWATDSLTMRMSSFYRRPGAD